MFKKAVAGITGVALLVGVSACGGSGSELSGVVEKGDTYTETKKALTDAYLYLNSDYKIEPAATDPDYIDMTMTGDAWKVVKIDETTEPPVITFEKEHSVGIESLIKADDNWGDAWQALTDAGWTANDYATKTDDGKTPINNDNWTVVSIDNSSSKPVIHLKHNETDAGDSETDTAKEPTLDGLTAGYALTACDTRGKLENPYGYNPAHFLGATSTTVSDHSILAIYTAKVKNQYNAERKVTVTCNVQGTNEFPEVFGWLQQ